MTLRIGGIRVGRNFSYTIFIICALEMAIYVSMVLSEDVVASDKKPTESFLEREKSNLVLFAAPSPNEKAEERHKQYLEQAQEAAKREALTREIELDQRGQEKIAEKIEDLEVQRPKTHLHVAEEVTGSAAKEDEPNGYRQFLSSSWALPLLDSSSSFADDGMILSSIAELLFHHGLQLFCVWKCRKYIAKYLKSHFFTECYALLKYNLKKPARLESFRYNTRYCIEMLYRVNGSFAAMIIALPDEFREPACVFYLILRALSTIENDTSVSISQRKEELINFHNRLVDKSWSTRTYGQGFNKELLGNFDQVIELYSRQNEKYRDIIKDSTRRMGQGLSEYLGKDLVSTRDYDNYCHYVAGLVGISLTAMFGCGKDESDDITKSLQRANNLGLFLQKTNIIYDSFQGINSPTGRILIPQDIWSKYVDKPEDLKEPRFAQEATGCINELVIDAFNHLHSSLEHMFFINDPTIFNFYAIPLVLAAATLSESFGKSEVFRKCTPIRKGLAARIFLEVKDFKSLCSYLLQFINSIDSRIMKDDPNADSLRESLHNLKNYINDMRWVDEMTPHKFHAL